MPGSLVLPAGGDGMNAAERSWPVWGTRAHLLVTDPAALDGACSIAEEWLRSIGDACDRFRPDSELSRLGDASDGIGISALLARLLAAALDAAERTAGIVDPTVGAALAAAGYDRDLRLVLEEDRPVRAVLTEVPGWRRVQLDGERLTMPRGVRLDLGATAKAFAADRIAADVAERLHTGVLANLGGDIATAGPGPSAGWQVTVQDLPHDPAGQVSLRAGWGLATSSTQRRTWSAAGEVRHHIIDPRTGRSAPPVWRSVSVAAPRAVTANTYSTAAVVLGDEALDELVAIGLPARLVAASGLVITVNGWPDDAVPPEATDA